MSVRHAAGAVFKAFAAHIAVFFVRMADFALAVLRVTRNVVAVMMFMFAAAAFFVFMVMFHTTTAFAMLMFVVVLMPTATFSMTMFVMVFFPTTAAVMMVLMFFTAAGIVFMPFMSMNFAAAACFVMAVLVFRLMAVPMPALGTVFMVMVATAASPIFMVMVMRAHFITAVSYIR